MSAQERTEAPTSKRKRDARKKGQVARSPELTAWLQVLAATFLLPLSFSLGGGAFTELVGQMEAAAERPDPAAALRLLGVAGMAGAKFLAPLVVGVLVLGLAGSIAQTGLAWTPSMLAPKWERVNPQKGIKRIVSVSSVWQAAKSLLKVVILAAVALGPLRHLTEVLAGASRPPAGEVMGTTAAAVLGLARNMALAGLVVAAADYAYQRHRTTKGVKMTRQEVRDEFRQSEGDPMQKAHRRRIQMERSRNRMMADVADATVVVVNPTHVAVALRYAPGSGAPRVVAKGKGEIAARIRAQAERHRVPLVTDVPLARSLHAACKLGQEIPADLYEAVARILAFVFSLERRVA